MSTGPGTIYRGLWYCDNDYGRRNRLGGLAVAAGHALEYTVPKELRQKHPEIRAIISGKPHDHLVKWTHPLVAEAIADACLAALKNDPELKTFSLSPDDGVGWDESDDAKFDAGDFDPALRLRVQDGPPDGARQPRGRAGDGEAPGRQVRRCSPTPTTPARRSARRCTRPSSRRSPRSRSAGPTR